MTFIPWASAASTSSPRKSRLAEPAVERGEDEVLQVQLLRFLDPVAGLPAAVGDVLLPGGAVVVGRAGPQAPVQEQATGGGAQERLARVRQFGVGGRDAHQRECSERNQHGGQSGNPST